MNKKTLHLTTLVLVTIVALTSCNRDMPQFASGRFHHNELDNKHEAATSAFRQRERIQPVALRQAEGLKTESGSEVVAAIPVKDNVVKHSLFARLFHKKAAKAAVNVSSLNTITTEMVIKPDFSKQNTEVVKVHHRHGLFHNGDRLLCAIICIFIPFLGVGLYEGLSVNFWIDLLLTLLFYVPGLVFGLIVILSN